MTEFDRDRWAKICSTFDALIELDVAARTERLIAIGRSDPEARRALEELLAADAEADERLARMERVFGASLSPANQIESFDALALVGQTVGHFRILEPLAAGGMGVVYRAEDTQLARPVAIKFPLREHRLDRHDRERFLREARTAGALDHPNLCSIYEVGQTHEGHLFIAMALYDGETLKARISRDGPLPVAEALAIAAQIARGLGAVHRAGIVHRDLKPANVMLLPDGRVKILDFGLAKITNVGLTVSRATLGTISYMAPEQVRGESLDSRTDLWALGVLIYEMLTGRCPFVGEYQIAISHAIVYAAPVRPRAFRAELGVEIEELVQKLLSKEPSQRFSSAENVAEQITTVQHSPGRNGRVRELDSFFSRRRSSLGVTAALAILLTVVAFSAWLLRADEATRSSDPLLVAVLPFYNLNEGENSDYLASGLSDAVAAQLARLQTVAVPIGLPALDDRGMGAPLPQMAQELEVDAIVRGSIHRNDDEVRLDLQLFGTESGGQSWEHSYYGETAALPELQRTATFAIIAALRLDLTAAERALIARLPTVNGQAYDLYLRARHLELRGALPDIVPGSMESMQRAQSFYARARELDPEFADARARLAMSHVQSAMGNDPTQARRDQARLEAEAALRLQPGLPEAHEALASYWALQGDHLKAVEELRLALAGFPNRSDLHLRLGLGYRRLGRWEEAVDELEQAILVDPRNRMGYIQAAVTYSRLRRYGDSVKHWDRLIAMEPAGDPFPHLVRGHVYLRFHGTIDSLEVALTRIPSGRDDGGMTTWARYFVLLIQRRHADALAMLDGARHPVSRDGLVYQPVTLMRAVMLNGLGDHAAARVNYEDARALLEDSAAAHPDDSSIRIALGIAYAGLGRKADAIREVRHAMALVPLTEDNPLATAAMGGAAEVFAQLGENNAALELLELLLTIPAGREVSVPLLRIDPRFDPLRSDPRFDHMMKRFTTY